MDSTSKKINSYIQLQLKLLLLFTMLFVYKYIYINRINQEAFLRLFLITAFFLWLLKLIILEELNWQETPLNLPLLLFILVMSISLIRNENLFIGLKDFINFLAYLILFFLIINSISNQKQINSFLQLYFLIAFLIAFYTLLQYYGFDPFFSGIHLLTSTLGQKNWIANYLALSFFITSPFFILSKEKRFKVIYYILLSILYTNIMICQSRGIWISIFVSVILGFYFIYKFKLFKSFRENRKWLILLILTFFVITIVYSTENPLNKSTETVIHRAATTFDKNDISINTRLLIWKNTLNMIQDYPWLGSGIGTFKLNYQIYQASYLQKNPEDLKYWIKAGEAHNEYLQLWAELGIIGLGMFILIIYFYYKSILKFLKKEKNDQEQLTMLGMLIGTTCFLIHCLFSFPLHVPALSAAFFIMIGLNIRFTLGFDLDEEKQSDRPLKKVDFKNSKIIKAIIIILLLAITVFLINNMVIRPYFAELYYYRGMIFNLNYDFENSLPIIKRAIDLDAHNGRIIHALGATYYNLNRYDEAIDFFQIARRYEIDKNTFFLLGLCYFNKEMYKEAEEELKYAIYIEPKFTKGYHYLGLLYFQKGDFDKAIEQWNEILEIEPNFPNKYIVLNNLGIVYNKKEMPDKALEYFVHALQFVPEDHPIEEEIEKEINKIYKSKLKN